jgi:hypothetical protein
MTAAFSGAGFGERSIASKEAAADHEARVKPLRSALDRLKGELAAIEEPAAARLLLPKYRALERERERDGEKQRIPLNPLYNRNRFAPVRARWVRLAVTGHQGPRALVRNLTLAPGGTEVATWKAEAAATAGPPTPSAASGTAWSPSIGWRSRTTAGRGARLPLPRTT